MNRLDWRARALAAEGQVAAVRALAEEYEAAATPPETPTDAALLGVALRLRAALDLDPAEQGRRLASEREDLIAQGVDPNDLLVPLHPEREESRKEEDGGLLD